jgi:hypothetical protein
MALKNFKGLGTVGALEKPIEFEYKPLGLESFAQPIAQMQQRYDLTEQAIDESKFGIESLDPHDTRATELASKLEQDKNDILNELARTGNSRQAAKALNKLNKFYNEDPEIVNYRTNKKFRQEDLAAQQKRVDENETTQIDLDKAAFMTADKFAKKVAQSPFNRETKSGPNIEKLTIERNIEDDIIELATQLAKGTPLQTDDQFLKVAASLGIDAEAIKVTSQKRELGQTSGELFRLLNNSKNFKHFIENRGEREFYAATAPNSPWYEPGFEEGVINKRFDELQAGIDAEENPEKKKELENAKKQLDASLKEAIDAGDITPLAHQIYISDLAAKTIKDISYGAADLYDVLSTKLNIQDLSSSSAGRELNKNPEEYKVTTQMISPIVGVKQSEASVMPGGAVSDTRVQEQIYNGQLEIGESLTKDSPKTEELKTNLESKKTELLQEFGDNKLYNSNGDIIALKDSAPMKIMEEGFEVQVSNYNDISQTSSYFKKRDENLKAIKARNKEIEKELETTNSANEKRALRAELSQNNEDLFNQEEVLIGETAFLELKLKDAISKLPDGPDKARYTELMNSEEGVISVLSEMEKELYESIDNFTEPVEEKLKELTTFDITLSSEQRAREYKKRTINFPNELSEAIHSNISKFTTNPLYKSFKNWKAETIIPQVPVRHQVVMDDRFNKFTKGESEVLKNYLFFDNEGQGNAKVIKFNPGTNKINENLSAAEAARLEEQNLSLNLEADYDKDSMKFQGTALGEDGRELIIVSLDKEEAKLTEVLKNIGGATDSKTINKLAAIIQSKDEEGLENLNVYEEAIAKKVITYLKNTPDEITVAVGGTNVNLLKAASENTLDAIKNAIATDDQRNIKQWLDNYSNLAVISSSNRTDYNQNLIKLNNMIKANNTVDYIYESPYSAKPLPNGTTQEFALSYRKQKDSPSIIAVVTKIIRDENNNFISAEDVRTHLIPKPTAQILFSYNLMYGVGDERDALRDKQGQIDVPAFQYDID